MAESRNSDKKSPLVVEMTAGEKFAVWYDKHGKKVTAVLSAAIIVVAGIQLYRWNENRNKEAMNTAFGTALIKLQTAQGEADQAKRKADFAEGITAAEKVVQEYGNTFVGRQAQFQIANAYYDYSTSGTSAVKEENDKHRIENLEKALAAFEKYAAGAKEPKDKAKAQLALGNTLESLSVAKSDPALLEKAETAYKSAVDADKISFVGAQAKLELARLYSSSGDEAKKAEAVKLYEDVAKNRPNEVFVTEAKKNFPEVKLPMGGTLSQDKYVEAMNRAKWSFKSEAEQAVKQ